MRPDVEAAQLDLRFEAELSGKNLSIVCEYKTDFFNPGTIEQLLASYRGILETLLKSPVTKLADFGIAARLKAKALPPSRRKKTWQQ